MRRSAVVRGLAAGAVLTTALLATPKLVTAGASTVAKLGAPTSVVAIAERNFSTTGDVRVWWHAPTSQGRSPITLYSATTTPGSRTCSASENSCLLKGLSKGVDYTVRVRAVNKQGPGPYSTSSRVQLGPMVSFTSAYYDVYDQQVTVKLNQPSSNTVRLKYVISPGECAGATVASAFVPGSFGFEPAVIVFPPGKTSESLTLSSVGPNGPCPIATELGLSGIPNVGLTLVNSTNAVAGTQYQTFVYDDFGAENT